MSPEYGATCGFFPVDELTLDYLRLTGRPRERIALVEALLQGEPALARPGRARPSTRRSSSSTSATSSRRSPGRAGRRTACRSAARSSRSSRRSTRSASSTTNGALAETFPASDPTTEQAPAGSRAPSRRRAVAHDHPAGGHRVRVTLDGEEFALDHGSVVIAAITSCTNTSNPQVMVAAGLLAKKAVERGLRAQARGSSRRSRPARGS